MKLLKLLLALLAFALAAWVLWHYRLAITEGSR